MSAEQDSNLFFYLLIIILRLFHTPLYLCEMQRIAFRPLMFTGQEIPRNFQENHLCQIS